MFSVKRGNQFQLAAIAYFIIGNLVFGLIVGLMGGEIGIVPSILVSQVLFVGGAILVYAVLKRVDFDKDFYIKPLNWMDALICVGIAWMIMPLLSAINVLSQFVVQNQIQEALIEMVELPYILTLLLTALSPAVFEELLSRSIILRNYQKQPVIVTCAVSGIFFGFIHLNINQFLYALVMGALMCYIVMITDSVLSAMIIHFTINATGTTTLYISTWFMKVFDASGSLTEELLSATAPTTTELLISLVAVLLMAAFFSPVAALLIQMLLGRHGKSFRGSLHMITSEFMRQPLEEPLYTFSKELTEQKEGNTYIPEPPAEKVLTTSLILSGVCFVIFAVLLELAM